MNFNIPFSIICFLSVIALLWIYGFAAANFQNTSNKTIDAEFGFYPIFFVNYYQLAWMPS